MAGVRHVGLFVPDGGEQVVLADRLLDWGELAAAPREPDRVSALMPVYQDWWLTGPGIDSALTRAGRHQGRDVDLEVVAVDNASRWAVTSILTQRFGVDERVRLVRMPRNTNFALGTNLAYAHSSGATVVCLNNDTEALDGWVAPLLDALADDEVVGAQPVLLYPDGSVQAAGTSFSGGAGMPFHFLIGHPLEDVPTTTPITFPAVTAACVAMPARRYAQAEGFDEIFVNGMEDVDLCLRLVERARTAGLADPAFRVVPQSRLVHAESKSPGRGTHIGYNRALFLARWRGRLPGAARERWTDAGLELSGVQVAGERDAERLLGVTPIVTRPARVVTHGPAAGLPRLRFALKNAAWGGRKGDQWGDTTFADDLAAGLRSWGQEVVIDRRGAHERPLSDHLDQVTIWVRGLLEPVPQPGAVNFLWVISHPDLVTTRELQQGWDRIYSAGASWAARAAREAGVEIDVLLQATNAARFSAAGRRLEKAPDTLFVGRPRGVLRPIVRDATQVAERVGAELDIYGDGWEEFIDASKHVRADYLHPDHVPAAYRSARIVLNDHWSDMARLGFFSNRLFDAVASGARVVSDRVAGIEEVFGPSVHAYTSRMHLGELLAPDSAEWAPAEVIAANAARVAAAHSFTERARQFLVAAYAQLGIAHEQLLDPEVVPSPGDDLPV